MSPGERAPLGRREPARPQYASRAPGFPSFYSPYGVPNPNAWLGAPLISMAGRVPPQRHTPVSKLAMQAQGAPLIIQDRPDRRKFNTEQRNHRTPSSLEQHSEANRNRCERPTDNNRSRNQQHHQQSRSARGGRANNTDAVSVASDESSGSNNSETMLPRIIKPRKRRKKDRKPNNMATHDLSTTNLEVDVEQHCNMHAPNGHGMYDENYRRELNLPYRLGVKVFDYSDSATESYKVSALGEALEATRFGVAEAASPAESAVSSCQCRYCDPVGQIWDADAIAGLLDESSSADFAPTTLDESMKVVGRRADSTLRRSWSDPFARSFERREPITNEPASSAPNLYSLFPPPRRANSPLESRSSLALEISSEIVTSINGHRDLEIKLFSKSPPAVSSDRKSFFGGHSESGKSVCKSDLKVDSVVIIGNTENRVKTDGSKKCEELSESGCSSAFSSGGFSRNQCDLTLVTV